MFLQLLFSLFIATTLCVADPKPSCILPPLPEHGTYTTGNGANAEPGKAFDYVLLNFTCNHGYGVVGTNTLYCVQGVWSTAVPKCVRLCQLPKDPSVTYRCLVSGSLDGHRECSEQEPDGTIVVPNCNSPNYYSPGVLPHMKCFEGSWDYVAICQAECGRITPRGTSLILDGTPSESGQMPWHAAVYRKTSKPYMQICGGSIISPKIVISAAHCFWSDVDKLKPASDYAVAAGKRFRPWDDQYDVNAQKSDVKNIHIPARFQGNAANYQDDISVVILATPFEYRIDVRPVCLDFDVAFDRFQLETGKTGKVPAYEVNSQGKLHPALQVVDIKSIDLETCLSKTSSDFREYITSDKICGEFLNDKFYCRGNSGAGAVYPEMDPGAARYYLRGIISTGPRGSDDSCKVKIAALTHIVKHEHFIKELI